MGAPGTTRSARVHEVLDRPGGRTLLGVLHSARYYRETKQWVPVRWNREGYWEVHFPDAVIPQEHPDPHEYRDKEAIARTAYFDRYVPVAGDVVVHVGAGAGWEANLLARQVGPTGKVYLIEAHPGTFEWMARRVSASELSNVTPMCVAVAERNGTVSISDLDRHQLNRLVDGPGLTIEARTLAQIFADEGIDRVDLLTINIEGAERDAIKGLGDAAASVQRLAVSCHDFLADRGGDDSTRTKVDVISLLQEAGFSVDEHDQDDPRDWLRDYVYAERT